MGLLAHPIRPTPVAAYRATRAPSTKGDSPPLASLAIAITGVDSQASGAFTWTFMAWLVHPQFGKKDMSGTTEVSVGTSAAQTREFVATAVRSRASIALGAAGYDVPPDRIAAVVL
jgi:hypothetical protein